MSFEENVEIVGKTVEGAGVSVIAIGILWATLRYAQCRGRGERSYREYRQGVGRAILLGLEFLVAGDIIRTVAIHPTYSSVGLLAAIVLIRTFLSFSLELELEGAWPWQRKPEGEVPS